MESKCIDFEFGLRLESITLLIMILCTSTSEGVTKFIKWKQTDRKRHRIKKSKGLRNLPHACELPLGHLVWPLNSTLVIIYLVS